MTGCLRVLEGQTDEVNCASVLPDGWRAVSVSGDKTLRVWELDSCRCMVLVYLPAPRNSVVSSSALGQVIAGTKTGQIIQFDLRGMSWTAASQAS
jgi:WD40 repeat protein